MDVHPESDFLVTATRNQEVEKHVRSVVIVQDILEIQTQKLISLDENGNNTLYSGLLLKPAQLKVITRFSNSAFIL